MTDIYTSLTVAVVDDDQRVLESLGNLLESADYTASLFASAAVFLESGCLMHIGCLISDIDMPAMDGFELLRAVRARRAELPVILITAHPDLLDQLPSIGLGLCRMFNKPFDAQELLAAVSDALPAPGPRKPQCL